MFVSAILCSVYVNDREVEAVTDVQERFNRNLGFAAEKYNVARLPLSLSRSLSQGAGLHNRFTPTHSQHFKGVCLHTRKNRQRERKIEGAVAFRTGNLIQRCKSFACHKQNASCLSKHPRNAAAASSFSPAAPFLTPCSGLHSIIELLFRTASEGQSSVVRTG